LRSFLSPVPNAGKTKMANCRNAQRFAKNLVPECDHRPMMVTLQVRRNLSADDALALLHARDVPRAIRTMEYVDHYDEIRQAEVPIP
jgi:hypothetical protein